MLRQLAAPFAAAARDGLNKGLAALVWVLVAIGLGATGLGLLLAALVMGLSLLVGPILACGLMGAALVLLAFAITALRRNRPAEAPIPPAPKDSPEQIAFSLGFALSRMILAGRK